LPFYKDPIVIGGLDGSKRMDLIIANMRGIIRATGVRVVILLLALMVGSLKLPGLIMP
jgi:hypothetical protein